MAKKLNIRDRIKEFRRVKPEELLDHEKNWRTHPEAQQGALKGMLQEIGIAGALTAYHSARNNGKLTLIDGHLRKATESVAWPTLILDVDDAEADLLLATLDPLSAIAGTNAAALEDLLRGVDTGNAELMAFLDELGQKAGIVPGEWGDALGGMPTGDREPFQQMTFTLSDQQAETVSRAIDQAKQSGRGVKPDNENSNGNALACIAEAYLG